MFYIIENQIKSDGTVNTSTQGRRTFASGLSYFFERCSKAPMNVSFTKIAVSLCDSELNVIRHEILDGAYVEPQEAVE